MFLTSLDFGLHAPAGLSPLTQVVLGFFVATLVSELLVLVLPPDLLQALLFQVSCREVRIEVGASFEFVRCCVLDLLFVVGVESLERGFKCGAFCLAKSTRCGRESIRTCACSRGGTSGGTSNIDALTDRNIVDASKLGRHEPMLRLLLLKDTKLVVSLLDSVHSIRVLLAEELVLVGLNAHC